MAMFCSTQKLEMTHERMRRHIKAPFAGKQFACLQYWRHSSREGDPITHALHQPPLYWLGSDEKKHVSSNVQVCPSKHMQFHM